LSDCGRDLGRIRRDHSHYRSTVHHSRNRLALLAVQFVHHLARKVPSLRQGWTRLSRVNRPTPLREIHVPTGAPPADLESSSAAVRAAFMGLVAADIDDDLDFVQRGEGLGDCLRATRTSAFGLRVGRQVITEVFFLNETSAVVRWTVELHAGPRPEDVSTFPLEGRAVRQDGRWLIERGTFCELVGRLGVRCPPLRAGTH
jgi:hypothetical protein